MTEYKAVKFLTLHYWAPGKTGECFTPIWSLSIRCQVVIESTQNRKFVRKTNECQQKNSY